MILRSMCTLCDKAACMSVVKKAKSEIVAAPVSEHADVT